MSNKYFSGRKGVYLFCDICGQACYAWEAVKLSAATGRGGLLVCPKDADEIDFGLIPTKAIEELKVKFTRINHTNLSNGSDPFDIETDTGLGV